MKIKEYTIIIIIVSKSIEQSSVWRISSSIAFFSFKSFFRSFFKNLRYPIPNFDPNTRKSILFDIESRFFSIKRLRGWGTYIVSMSTRNSREEFQNIIRSSVFIYYKPIYNIEPVKVEFLHWQKKVLRGRLFQQTILNAVRVFEGQEFGQGKFYTRCPKK